MKGKRAGDEGAVSANAGSGGDGDKSVSSAARKGGKPAKKAGSPPKKHQPAKESRGDGAEEDKVSPRTILYVAVAAVMLYLIYSSYISDKQASAGPGQPTAIDRTPVNVITVNDMRCGQGCDIGNLIAQLKVMFPGMVLKELDIGSDEGKAVYEEAKLTVLPAILFDRSVEGTKAYPDLARYLEAAGKYSSLRVGANWLPYCDATSEHCGEDKCRERLSCRPESPKTLDVYVMSQCPYGMLALDSMRDILGAFKGEISYTVHYIGQVDSAGTLQSLHGQAEVDDDLRSICAKKYYPQDNEYMEYIWCRNKVLEGGGAQDWGKCASDSGMDVDRLKACAEGDEGKRLLAEDFTAADALKIGRSPTFLVNGKNMFNAVIPSDIQAGYCGMNSGLAGCAVNLTGAPNPLATQGAGCGT